MNGTGAGGAVEPEKVVTTPEADDEDESQDTPPEKVPDVDPLDAITDEEVRNEMKRLRAISRRGGLKADTDTKEDTPPEPSAYATKDDLKRLATNEAKKLVAPEVKALWNELVAVPLGGFDPMDAESIKDNILKRYQIYRLDHPELPADPMKDFMVTTGAGGSASAKGEPKASEAKLPGFKEPTDPKDWYPAKK
jgi:hypothetical protein